MSDRISDLLLELCSPKSNLEQSSIFLYRLYMKTFHWHIRSPIQKEMRLWRATFKLLLISAIPQLSWCKADFFCFFCFAFSIIGNECILQDWALDGTLVQLSQEWIWAQRQWPICPCYFSKGSLWSFRRNQKAIHAPLGHLQIVAFAPYSRKGFWALLPRSQKHLNYTFVEGKEIKCLCVNLKNLNAIQKCQSYIYEHLFHPRKWIRIFTIK